jgi:signal peptidase I
MAIDPYGREGSTDRGDETDPRYRQRGADGDRYRTFDGHESGGGRPYAGDGWGDRGGYRSGSGSNGYGSTGGYDDGYRRGGDAGRDWRSGGRDPRGGDAGRDWRGQGGQGGNRYNDGARERPPARRARPSDDEIGGGAPTWRSRVRAKRKNMPLWQELPLLLIVAFCLAVLIRTFLVQAFFIPSSSMEKTLLIGDRVLVNKILYDVREPARGEVVVFKGPDNWAPENQQDNDAGFFAKLGRTVGDLIGISQPGEKDFIKRVIGLPGDVVACCDNEGRVTVNGYALDESSYVTDDSPIDVPPSPRECRSRRFEPVTVQAGQMFVMGDHRVVSQDSRCQGQVPIENVIGRAFVILWPSGRWAGLPVPETFAKVPKPFAAAPLGPKTGVPVPRVGTTGVLDVVFLAPLAASLAVPARSRRHGWRRRRRLRV